MAGFGKTKEAIAEKKEEEVVAEEQATSPLNITGSDPFTALRKELGLMDNMPQTHLFTALIGHENTGKTAVVTDAFSRDERAEKAGEELWIVDFDGGGAANKSAFHNDNNRIKCWEPMVMMQSDRTAFDYGASHERVMAILQYAMDIAEKQRDSNYEGVKIWGVLFTGIDDWDDICKNCMYIEDLGIANDDIEASNWNVKVDTQWLWAIRKNRFRQLTGFSRGLLKKGVRIFWETHLKVSNFSYGKDVEPKWVPAWEKSSDYTVFQIIRCERRDTLDTETGETIQSEYTATFEKSKTSAKLQGQRRTILITEQGKEPQWFGLPELYDGSL